MSSFSPPDDKEIERIRNCFDGEACDFCKDYEKSGLSKSSQILLDRLSEYGLDGRRLLDLGCGVGSFSFEALKRGVSSSVGLDLSPEMIASASKLSEQDGLGGKASFDVGDAAEVDLPPAEIVVLDKVMCCYPRIDDLLRNSSGASLEYYGFVIPRLEGALRLATTPIVFVINMISRLMRRSLFYAHDIAKIDMTLREKHLIRIFRRASGIWLVFIYRRISDGRGVGPTWRKPWYSLCLSSDMTAGRGDP
ncbi:MAG: class I SAM-dependent methyltransferase [Candidatus Geothermarchaeales archaeon]